MTDYGHDLLFGAFVTPLAADARRVVEIARVADRAGLDLVTFQDHPYQPAFLDTSTLLAYVAAATERVRLSANVANLLLRPPAVLARAAATLDILSGGRFELGLGAGGFREAAAAMGARLLTPGQAVDALREAIGVIRAIWDVGTPGGIRIQGEHYTLAGAKRGPRPAHDVAIWIGAYGPRMLALTGELGDGWLPTFEYLERAGGLAAGNARIDDAARAAGRDPAAVRRLLNLMGARFDSASSGLLDGPPEAWVDQIAALALDHGVSAFIVGGDDPVALERYAAEVAPAVREIVARERAGGAPPRS